MQAQPGRDSWRSGRRGRRLTACNASANEGRTRANRVRPSFVQFEISARPWPSKRLFAAHEASEQRLLRSPPSSSALPFAHHKAGERRPFAGRQVRGAIARVRCRSSNITPLVGRDAADQTRRRLPSDMKSACLQEKRQNLAPFTAPGTFHQPRASRSRPETTREASHGLPRTATGSVKGGPAVSRSSGSAFRRAAPIRPSPRRCACGTSQAAR